MFYQGFVRGTFALVSYLFGRLTWQILHHLLFNLRVVFQSFLETKHSIHLFLLPHLAVNLAQSSTSFASIWHFAFSVPFHRVDEPFMLGEFTLGPKVLPA